MNSGIGLLGCLAIYALLNLMAVSGVAICKYSLELQHILAVGLLCGYGSGRGCVFKKNCTPVI